MLTDAPPRKANRAGFLESDRIRALDLPQDVGLLAIAQSVESPMKAGTTADVRRACAEFGQPPLPKRTATSGMCRPATAACGGNQSPGASHPDFSGDQLRCLFPETPLQNRAIGNQKTAPIARSRPRFRFIRRCPVMPPLAWQFAGTPSPH